MEDTHFPWVLWHGERLHSAEGPCPLMADLPKSTRLGGKSRGSP